MVPLALRSLAGATCIATSPGIAILVSAARIELVSSSARVTSAKSQPKLLDVGRYRDRDP